jgi:hypothetical protein
MIGWRHLLPARVRGSEKERGARIRKAPEFRVSLSHPFAEKNGERMGHPTVCKSHQLNPTFPQGLKPTSFFAETMYGLKPVPFKALIHSEIAPDLFFAQFPSCFAFGAEFQRLNCGAVD